MNRASAPWVSAALVGTFVVCLAAVYGRGRPMSVDVVAMNDPERIGMVTEMTLRVHNSRSAVQHPIFTILSSFPFPVRWPIVHGPKNLPPGATAAYTIESPTDAAIPTGDEVVARVNDLSSHVFGASPPVLAALRDAPALVNPAFTRWTFDFATGQPAPLGWTVQGIRSPLETHLRVVRAVVAGHSAMTFILGGGGVGWAGIRVDQDIRDPTRVSRLFTGGFTALVYPTFTSTPGSGGQSTGPAGNILAIQIYAGGHVLWIVFSDAPPSWKVDRDVAVMVLRAPLNRWSSHRVDIKTVYRRLGWSEPDEILFSLFASCGAGTSKAGWPAFGTISQ